MTGLIPSAFFEANGYFVHEEPVLPADLVAEAVAGMDAIREGRYDTGRPPCESPWNPGDDPNVLCKIENPQFASRAIRAVVGHPALGRAVAEVTGGRRIQAWWVQLLYKPTATGAVGASKPVVGWHQDRAYWGSWTPESNLFTIWLALSDVGLDSGPMRFVPGSHKWGLGSENDFFSQDLEGQTKSMKISLPEGQVWTEAPAVMRAGGFSIHHNLTYHASGPNLEPWPRRSLAIHARTEASEPEGGIRAGLTEFIDNEELCPVLFET